MRVLVLHSDVAPDAPPDELDTLDSAAAVAEALEKHGHYAPKAAFAPDMAFLKGLLDTHKPDVVFNVVESVFGAGIYSSVAPALLDRLEITCAGRTTSNIGPRT